MYRSRSRDLKILTREHVQIPIPPSGSPNSDWQLKVRETLVDTVSKVVPKRLFSFEVNFVAENLVLSVGQGRMNPQEPLAAGDLDL